MIISCCFANPCQPTFHQPAFPMPMTASARLASPEGLAGFVRVAEPPPPPEAARRGGLPVNQLLGANLQQSFNMPFSNISFSSVGVLEVPAPPPGEGGGGSHQGFSKPTTSAGLAPARPFLGLRATHPRPPLHELGGTEECLEATVLGQILVMGLTHSE